MSRRDTSCLGFLGALQRSLMIEIFTETSLWGSVSRQENPSTTLLLSLSLCLVHDMYCLRHFFLGRHVDDQQVQHMLRLLSAAVL